MGGLEFFGFELETQVGDISIFEKGGFWSLFLELMVENAGVILNDCLFLVSLFHLNNY